MAKVMIVDDSPTEVHVLTTMLTKNGHEVVVANSGEDGVEIAKTEMPDLILMDVVMPGMNGFQATRQIAKNDKTASIPVIMVTTKDQETDKVWAMRQGAKDYIVKPVQEKALIEHVNMVLSS
ncbi:MAG: response regulator [Gammaproteobacteria bacterium]|nr:response regulator [Gammaproteobacteria bacterium]